MSLASACICVQKFHHDPVVHSAISNKIFSDNYSKAVFLDASVWPRNSVIKVSFVQQDMNVSPTWYTINSVRSYLSDEEMALEQAARAAPTYADAVKLIVETAISPIVKTYVQFEFVPEDQGDVRVRFDSTGGSSSLVGTNCLSSPERYTMTFGWMDVGTIIHEFSHSLGMLHEHQNPKGGIKWDKPAVYAWAAETQGWDQQTTDENILSPLPINEISGSPYDPKSVMAYFFPPELTLDGSSFTRNLRYSNTDYSWLAEKYGGDTNSIKPPSGSSAFPTWRLIVLLVLVVLAILLIVMR
jgi:hypothetical protein